MYFMDQKAPMLLILYACKRLSRIIYRIMHRDRDDTGLSVPEYKSGEKLMIN